MSIVIEGPYSFKDVDELKTPIYIFAPGRVRIEIGEVIVHVDNGLKFDIKIEDAWKDVKHASFDVPMRFAIINDQEE